MDRVPLRPRRRQRERSALDSLRSAAAKRRNSPTRKAASTISPGRRIRSGSRSSFTIPIRASRRKKGEGEEDGPAARDRPPLFQEGHRRLSDRALFASAIARSRHAQNRAAHFRQTRRPLAGLVAGRKGNRVCHQARRRPGPHRELGCLGDRRGAGRERTPAHHFARGRSGSELGQRAGLESRWQIDRLHSRRRSEENRIRRPLARDHPGRGRAGESADRKTRSQRRPAALGAGRQVGLRRGRR